MATKYCLVTISQWFLTGSTLHSWCRWDQCAILWQPVAILSALFCTLWSFPQLESLIEGVQMGEAYSRVLRQMDLYVITMVSLSWPQDVPARAFKIFSFFLALVTQLFIWLVKVCIVLKVMPRSLGAGSTLIFSPLILMQGSRRAWFGSGVKSVTVDFSADMIRFLSSRKSTTLSIYRFILSQRESTTGPVQYMLMSSAY